MLRTQLRNSLITTLVTIYLYVVFVVRRLEARWKKNSSKNPDENLAKYFFNRKTKLPIFQKIDHLIWEHLLVTVSHFFWLKIDLMVLVIVAFLPAVLFTTSLQKIKLSDYLRVRWRRQKQQQVMIFTWGIFFSANYWLFLMVLAWTFQPSFLNRRKYTLLVIRQFIIIISRFDWKLTKQQLHIKMSWID